MATRRVDDIDKTSDAVEVRWTLQGETWTVDLGDKSLAELHKLLTPYKVNKVGGTQARTKGKTDMRTLDDGTAYNHTEYLDWKRATSEGGKAPRGKANPADVRKFLSAQQP